VFIITYVQNISLFGRGENVNRDTFIIRFEEVGKVLPILRDTHFSKCCVVLTERFDPIQSRLFLKNKNGKKKYISQS
jgi:hypothetical protein